MKPCITYLCENHATNSIKKKKSKRIKIWVILFNVLKKHFYEKMVFRFVDIFKFSRINAIIG